MPRIRIILDHGRSRAFVPFDRFAQFALLRGRSLDSLLAELADLRRSNLRRLADLAPELGDLSKPGLHPELGEVDLGQLLAAWVVHDLGHVAQIGRVMARRLGEAVGPWRDYLPVLRPRRAGGPAPD